MFAYRSKLMAARGCALLACLAFLAGCLPRNDHPAAPIPTNLAANAGDGVVTLSWSEDAGMAGFAATGYNVKRATTRGGPYTTIASPASIGYTDTTVTNGTVYYYVVSAQNASGESGNSNEASASPKGPSAPPDAPTNLSATAGDGSVSLAWNASNGAKSYNVKRATTNGGPYTQIAAPTSNSYDDTGLTNGTTYYYVVSAVNSAGESPNSAQASATPAPGPPTTFGTWVNVTPAGVDLTSTLCGNFGSQSIAVDPAHPSNIYTEFNCQGIWKSTDYGLTWTGPINTGTNGALAGDCVGKISISPTSTASIPTIYEGCIRGNGTGFWKSTDGGVSWTNYVIPQSPGRQDYIAPVVDPYDQNHLLMSGHEQNILVESIDGGQTWTQITTDPGMLQNGGTAYIFFINTGSATTTRQTWLFIAQAAGGAVGTWRTSNGGTNWARVDTNENYGDAQIWQPDTSGVVFMAGIYSTLGSGVLRSADYGQTWAHVGNTGNESVVIGTSKLAYAMAGYPVGIGGQTDVNFEVATLPGTAAWALPGTPAALNQGTAELVAVNDGTSNILVGAMFNSGVWRYVEP